MQCVWHKMSSALDNVTSSAFSCSFWPQMAHAKARDRTDRWPVSPPCLTPLLPLTLSPAGRCKAAQHLSVRAAVCLCLALCVCEARDKHETRKTDSRRRPGGYQKAGGRGGLGKPFGRQQVEELLLLGLANDADIRRRVLCVCT